MADEETESVGTRGDEGAEQRRRFAPLRFLFRWTHLLTSTEPREQVRGVIWIILSSLFLAMALIMLFATGATDGAEWFEVVGGAAIVGSAGTAAGMLIGALFGIPKALTGEARHGGGDGGAPPPAGTADEDGPQRPRYQTNTNLEDVSDWLTKIIVGVGLVQFRAICERLERIGNDLAPALGGGPAADELAVAIIILHGAVGFLGGYLLARLILPELFQRSDAALGRP